MFLYPKKKRFLTIFKITEGPRWKKMLHLDELPFVGLRAITHNLITVGKARGGSNKWALRSQQQEMEEMGEGKQSRGQQE